MTVAKFYICGALTETYKCSAVSPSQEDLQRIREIKQDLLRNFGYAPIVYIEHGNDKEDYQECSSSKMSTLGSPDTV